MTGHANLSFGIELAVPLEIKNHSFAFDDLFLASHNSIESKALPYRTLRDEPSAQYAGILGKKAPERSSMASA